MSFDLAVLAMDASADAEQARAMAVRCWRSAAHAEGEVDDRIAAFYEALVTRFPPGSPDSPWMAAVGAGIDHVMLDDHADGGIVTCMVGAPHPVSGKFNASPATGEIRAQLPYRVSRGSRAVIRGLSSSASRQIAQFEKKNRLYPGDVAYAFRVWAEILRRESPRAEPSCEYEATGWRDMHARTLLEDVLQNVRPGGPALVAQADPQVTCTACGPVS